jgi:8-oxo-dGTP pyrophosphatase MutT (NUDIX family)
VNDDGGRLALSAGVVFLDSSSRVLLVHQSYGRLAWSLPGGILEEGESPHEAAHREVMEEIGLDATIGHLVGVYFNQRHNAMIFGFVGRLPDDAEPAITDRDELDDIGWFSIDRLPSPTRTSLRYLLGDAVAGHRGVSRTVSPDADTE